MSETFADRLRRLREEKGLTASALAASVGVSEGTIRQLESGQTKSPSFVVGLRLANQLSVDPFYLALGASATLNERMDVFDRRLARLEQRVDSLSAPKR
ncbi:MAG: helix-turn-helix transcriptional regulator [Candidatus Eremiobacteraeota bacterium]|nr:helix-turn-helix transcriptional regulator [Candidatus Eremiobacteraeota bacterium]